MKRRGYTLIELLAIIVILAVIGIITMPVVLGVIEKSRKGAFAATIQSIKEAANLYQEQGEMYGTLEGCVYFSFDHDVEKETIIENKKYIPVKELELKGELPTSGEVKVCSDTVTMDVKNNNYRGIYEDNQTIVGKKDDIESADETVPIIKVSTSTTLNEIKVIVAATVGKYGAVKEYYYSIDEGAYVKSKDPTYMFEQLKPGTDHKIQVYVVSKANKKSEEQEIDVTTATFGTCSIKVTDESKWAVSKNVTIEGTDSVARLQYKIKVGSNLENSVDWTDYVTTITLTENATETTPTTVYCRYIDKNLNTMSAVTKTVAKIDNTTPKVELIGNIGSEELTNQDVVLTAVAKNSVSKYSYEWYQYKENGYEEIENKEATYTIKKTEEKTYAVRVHNEANTYSEYSNLYTVKVDKEKPTKDAPIVEKKVEGDSYTLTVTNKQKDEVSGIETVKYMISNDDKNYKEQESNIFTNITPGLIYYVKTKTMDKATNESVSSVTKVELSKLSGKIELSSTNDNYTYPNAGTFTITKNISGGELSCLSSNENIVTCSISGTTVTVTPGTTKGSSTITIISKETEIYKEARVAYVAYTSHGLLSYTSTGYNKAYDGAAHSITVTSNGATITYSSDGVNYTSDKPSYINVGTYTTYYRIEKAGYNTINGKESVIITKANGSVTAPTEKSLTYTGSSQALVNGGSSSTGTIQYKLGSGNYGTSIPSATNAGTYTIYYKVVGDSNHNDVTEKSISVTIKRLATATVTSSNKSYTGSEQVAVTGSNVVLTGTIKAINVGTYTAYAEPNSNYAWNDGTTNKKTITWNINKANNVIQLSSTSGSYTYPTSGTFTITKNVSGGALSCSSSNTNVATCSISGTTVTVTPGTTKGTATITITSAETTNYNAGRAAYVATTLPGTLSVTANGYSGTYDGKAHGISVTSSGATIKYGTASGTYNLTTSPTYTNAGTYTVYYQVSKNGYETVTGSESVVIEKATNTLTLNTTKVDYSYPITVNITSNVSGGEIDVFTPDRIEEYITISGNTITVKVSREVLRNSGRNPVYVYVISKETTNYKQKAVHFDIEL